jgi:Signal peptidase, peptidase S26
MDPRQPRDACSRIPDGPTWPKPVGPRILIPGYPQWSWRQRDRALVLFGSYLTALAVGVLAWGTTIGMGVLLFAFATHAFSAADAIRQYAFPGFGRLVPAISASAGLGAFCYAPALVMASVYAWPIALDERPREGYLVNRWAYGDQPPSPGETVWLRPTRGARPKVARVVAGEGQRVEWSGDQFRVDGQVVEESPFRTPGSPGGLELTIPEGHVLVTFGGDPKRGKGLPGGWEIVDRSDVRGRAGARSYPIWDRQLLR